MSRTCPLCKGTGVEPVSGNAAEAYARGRDEGYEDGHERCYDEAYSLYADRDREF